MSEIDLSTVLRTRVDTQDPLALLVGDSTSKELKRLTDVLDMYDWRYGVFDSNKNHAQVVYSSMHTVLLNIDLIVVVLTDGAPTAAAIDTGYITGIASTPAYERPVLVYNTMEKDHWPFLLHTIDTTIDSISSVAALMDILELKRGIIDFGTRLRTALSILKSSR